MGRLVGAGLTVLAPVSVLAPSRAAAQTAAGLSGPPSEWKLELTASGTWYENPQFTSTDQSAAWSMNNRVALSTTQRFRTGSFSLSGFGGRLSYPEIKSYDQWTYGGAVGLNAAPSRSTKLTLSQTYARSNTRQLPSLDMEGLPIPTTGVDTATSQLGLAHRLSRRTQLEINGDFIWRQYDNETFVGGEQLQSTVGLAFGVGRSGAVVLGYGFSQSWWSGEQDRVHQVTLGMRNEPEKGGLSFDLGGGAAYIESTGDYYPAGHAQLGLRGRKASLSVGYVRDFGLAFGYGRQTIADRAMASFAWTPARRFSVTAAYSYGYRRDPADDSFRIHSDVATGGFNWGLTEDLRFTARYSWEDNRTEGYPEVRGGRATAALSYGIDWR